MAPNENVSHAEIWDDSLLVNSWNEALAEYEKYHSIHARGEKVEDILSAAEAEETEIGGEHLDYEDGQVHEDLHDDRHAKRNITEETADPKRQPQRNTSRTSEQETAPTPGQTSDGTQSKGPALPATLIGQVHDEGLKNLLMSWYYAGYYTGLHEGHQQGQQQQQQGSADRRDAKH